MPKKTELEVSAVNVPTQLKGLLETTSVKKRFAQILGNKAPAFISSIISAVSQNPALQEADPQSIIASATIAASLDLPVNPSLGMAHLVPYSGRCQFQMGWKGFVQLAMRTGQYKTINVAPVHEGEITKHNRITGEMEFGEPKSNKVIGYVAYFRLLNGFEKYYYLTKEEVEAHGRRYSKSYDTGLWSKDFDAMALKTTIKLLLSKFGLLSTEMQQAIAADQTIDGEYLDNPQAERQVQLEKEGEYEVTAKAKMSGKTTEEPVENIESLVDHAKKACYDYFTKAGYTNEDGNRLWLELIHKQDKKAKKASDLSIPQLKQMITELEEMQERLDKAMEASGFAGGEN